jgi:ATP-dependent helicase/DNAse subunit B
MLGSDVERGARMPISLIVGPPNSGRESVLLRRLEDALDRDPVLVVPTGDDAARFERELCGDGGAVIGISIRTFASLFEDAARAAALPLPPRLSEPERLALLRAAIEGTPLRLLRRSAARAGFAPALDALVRELQQALISPAELGAAAAELPDGEYERELTSLYASYVELRDRAERSDAGSRAAATLSAIRAQPDARGDRPLFVYGFDDLTEAQLELVGELGRSTEVVISVNYADREALKGGAELLARLGELGAEVAEEPAPDTSYTDRKSLRHLDRWLFEPRAEAADIDDGVALLECAGELGEAEAVGAEIARLLADGVAPDEIAIVARDVARRGPALGRTLARLEIPVAVETTVPLEHTAVGRSLVALCRAAGPDGEAEDLLAHLRADPRMAPAHVDWLERSIRRARPATIDEAISGWQTPPRHLAALRAVSTAGERMRALARIAGELAEAPHREAAPVGRGDADAETPFEPLELRAAAAAAELLAELAAIGELPGCEPPDLAQAAEAIEGARVPLWRGPAEGRVRIVDPYRMRAGRARHLFCVALQEGEFPRRATQDPLLSDERRSALGIAALRRRDPQDEERYLFHACVSRPTERLYLSWQACDDEGKPLARSPFVDEVLDLLGSDPEATEERLVRRRGLERVAFTASEAPTERELERATALAGPRIDEKRPGPLRADAVLANLGARDLVSASSLEGWLECSYRWFVNHELAPERLDPKPDPLRLGTVAHRALQRLYAQPPGEDSIPRPGDVARWKAQLAELLDEVAEEEGLRPAEPPDSVALARMRAQIGRFLDDESQLETQMRPRPDLLEIGFGFEDGPAALELGEIGLRGQIDRVDVAPDGSAALVRDYKTGSDAPGRKTWEAKGRLQLQLYVLAARERLGLEPIGGLYHPLGAYRDRRPRGIVIEGDPRLGELALVSGDSCDPEAFEAELERARALAAERAGAMRAGEITRNPIGGRCPTYCAFQSICRLERAVGLEEENGEAEGNS